MDFGGRLCGDIGAPPRHMEDGRTPLPAALSTRNALPCGTTTSRARKKLVTDILTWMWTEGQQPTTSAHGRNSNHGNTHSTHNPCTLAQYTIIQIMQWLFIQCQLIKGGHVDDAFCSEHGCA